MDKTKERTEMNNEIQKKLKFIISEIESLCEKNQFIRDEFGEYIGEIADIISVPAIVIRAIDKLDESYDALRMAAEFLQQESGRSKDEKKQKGRP